LKTIIPEEHYQEKQTETSIQQFFKEVKLGKLLQQSNFYKVKGFSVAFIFQAIFTLIFTGKNLYRLLELKSDDKIFGKDTVYRFLNSARHNWRKFLLLLSSTIIKQKLYPLTSQERENVLIIDDSLYSRSRSKSVELLARVFDHVKNKYTKGFRLLTLGWSDGNTFLPVAFSLLSSPNKENRLCGINEKIDKRTNGYKRRKESFKKATEVMFDLLDQIKDLKLPADYLLFDSWFAYPQVIKKVKDYGYQVICMVKATPKIYYTYQGKKADLKQIYSTVKKKRGRAKILASVVVGLPGEQSVKAKLVFVRDRNNKRNWLALLSTDITKEDEEIVRIYGKRWDIEVFFKMNKSYLGLAKEFQGRSYDMIFAHTTMVFTRYIMLALEARQSEDSKAIGGLFYEYCDELEDIKFIRALQLLLKLFKQALHSCLKLTEDNINELLGYFKANLPSFFTDKLGISICES